MDDEQTRPADRAECPYNAITKMHWEARLSGPQGALAELARQFTTDDCRITEHGILRSSSMDVTEDPEVARRVADRMATALSAALRILLDIDQAVIVHGLERVHNDGRRDVFVALHGAELRITAGSIATVVTHPDGTMDEHRASDPARTFLTAALNDDRIAEALSLRDAPNMSWGDLHKLFEKVSDAAGGDREMVKRNWTSSRKIDRFNHSANSVAVAGKDARHGVEKTAPPRNPMTLDEAKSFVDGLLHRWVVHLNRP